jgi:hypothetical protein
MKRFLVLADERSLRWNPPTMLDEMGTGGDICYVPLLFGYSNYSREGFRPLAVDFSDLGERPRDEARTVVAVQDGLWRCRSRSRRHEQSVVHEHGVVASVDRPADDASREQVEHGAAIKRALAGVVLGHIGQPDPVLRDRGEVAVD